MDFQRIADCLADISLEGSKLYKEGRLRMYGEEVEGFKDVVKYIYDPNFTTGLKAAKLDRCGVNNDGLIKTVGEIMEFLRNNTGSDYSAAVANGFIYQSEDENWQWAATGLVTKDLQIGISVTTLNKIYGKTFIPKVGIMRGMHAPEDMQGIYIATEKIDGNRRIIMNKPTGVEVYTRSGKRDYGLIDIEKEAEKLPKGFVYDTELAAVGDFADSIALRQATASIANSRGKRTGAKALIFDMIPQAEYDEGISKWGSFGRKARLAGVFGDLTALHVMEAWFLENGLPLVANSINALFHNHKTIRLEYFMPLPILGVVRNYKEAVELAAPIWETGGEGLMLNEYKSPYEVNPNPRKTLLKIKATKEYTLKCVDVLEGDKKYIGTLGSIVVEYKRSGDPATYLVKVGSGFADYLRQYYWNNTDAIIGKYVEIESFGESRNADGMYSLNCPIFKRIVGEVD